MSALPVLNDRVQLTDQPGDIWSNGLLMNGDKAVYATASPVNYSNGIQRTANGAIYCVDATAGLPAGTTWTNGLPFNNLGALCIANNPVVTWSNGIPFDANGAVCAAYYDPASLFVGGIPGVWYDPSDLTTLFQDSAGTLPVTAVEQPVGLMLDKSQGLVLGPELVVNGDFSGGTTTGWTGNTATLSVVSGALRATSSTSFGKFYPTNPLTTVAGRWYKLTFSIVANTSGGGTMRVGTFLTGNDLAQQSLGASARDWVVYFLATSTTSYLWFECGGTASGYIDSDNISVKELAGNHAFQATSASRPVLSSRYNLLERTEDFANAYWGKTAITLESSTVTAPDGSATAVRFSNTAATSTHRLASNAFANGLNRMTLWAKAGTASFISINRAVTDLQAIFDLSTGTVSSSAGCTATIAAADNGFYQLTVTPTSVAGQFFCVNFATTAANAAAGASFLGAGETMIIWHPDARVNNNGTTQPAYQRVNTATDYATTGFLPYLKFDGVDDSLSTNSISFTSTDKMSVFAGERRLGSAAGFIVELGTGTTANEFFLGINAVSNDYWMSLGGDGAFTSGSYSSPRTDVLAALYDLAGATPDEERRLRINGAQIVFSSNTGVNTGSFINAPLYIGRRNNASLPFNGQMYSMIIVGKAVTAGELSSTETYVNQKTGAY